MVADARVAPAITERLRCRRDEVGVKAVRLWWCAVRFTMVEHARNRLAVALMVVFVPLWVTLARLTVGSSPVQFRLRATGEILAANGSRLTEITGAMNAITGIIGFMMFAATFSSGSFDQRLVMAGFPGVTCWPRKWPA